MDNSNMYLEKIFKNHDNTRAIIYDDEVCTYGDLKHRVSQFNMENVLNHSVVGIVGDYNISSVICILACIKKKLTIMPLSTSDNDIDSKLVEGQADYLYSNGEFIKLKSKKSKNILIKNLQKQNKSGLILFSSGSTGKPKAIIHDLDNFLNFYLQKKQKRINVLLFLMFDHIGGINTLFNVLCMGACGIAISNRKNVNNIAKCIQDYKIELLPVNPSLLNLFLILNIKKEFDFSSLKIVTYGTEQMPDSLLNRLKIEFPKVRFHQTFGASEIGITQTQTKNNLISIKNADYKIINNELYIKSSTQALGYLNSDNNAFNSDGYFATGDLVEVINHDNEEYIRIIGRTKEVINVGGEKVIPQEVEGIILQMKGIADCLVYGEENAITGQSVSAKIVLDKNEMLDSYLHDVSQNKQVSSNIEIKNIIRKFCKNKISNYKIPSKVEVVESLQISDRFKKIRKQ